MSLCDSVDALPQERRQSKAPLGDGDLIGPCLRSVVRQPRLQPRVAPFDLYVLKPARRGILAQRPLARGIPQPEAHLTLLGERVEDEQDVVRPRIGDEDFPPAPTVIGPPLVAAPVLPGEDDWVLVSRADVDSRWVIPAGGAYIVEPLFVDCSHCGKGFRILRGDIGFFAWVFEKVIQFLAVDELVPLNISLINELALLAGKMDINIWEVIDAANSKPYGFQAFYPGPGIGGHCIPLDPFYLEYIAKNYNFDLTMIHAAGHIDNLMPHRMTIKISSALNRQKKSINGSKILFLGVAYKADISDERESPALKIMDEVLKKCGHVMYHDPYIPEVTTEGGHHYKSVPFGAVEDVDCVVITVGHSAFNGDDIKKKARLVVDLRNLIREGSEKVYKL